MSHAAMTWALKQRGLKPAVWKVLVHLADRHNPDLGYSFATQDLLARDTEVSRASLNRHLAELEQAGLVGRVAKKDPASGLQLNTRYYIAFDTDLKTLDVVDRVSNCDTENRVSKTAKSVSHSSETLITSKITRKNPLTPQRAEGGKPQDMVPKGFDVVWNAWPEAGRGSDDAGQGAFDQLTDRDRASLLHVIASYSATVYQRFLRRNVPIPNLTTMIRDRAFLEFANSPPPVDEDGYFRTSPGRPEWNDWLDHVEKANGLPMMVRVRERGWLLTETRWPKGKRP